MSIFPESNPAPPVWRWYVVYCILMALLYLFVVGAGLVMLFLDPDLLEEEALVIRIQGVIFVGLGLALLVVYAAAPFLPKKSWNWIYGLVMIGIGMTSVCCLPVTVPLLIFWIRPETRYFFGRE